VDVSGDIEHELVPGEPIPDVQLTITGPTKTEYVLGEGFSSEGLTATIRYSNGTTATTTSDFILFWNGTTINNGNTAVTADTGYKRIEVWWQGGLADFTILVWNSFTITNTSEWNTAINAIKNGGDDECYSLTIGGTVSVSPSSADSPTFGDVSNLTVLLKGSGTLSLNNNGSLFYLQGDRSVTLQHLIIDGPRLEGRSGNSEPVVYVGYSRASYEGNLVSMRGMEMRNGTITGNTHGNGVSVRNCTFTMRGGKISGNMRGVLVDVSFFEMNGGEISGNGTVNGNGGGVYVNSGRFEMNGGEISGNIANVGGGVYVDAGSSFSKSGNGGIIYGDDNNTHTAGSTENTAFADSGAGHAVFYHKDSSNQHWRDTTLGENDDISTDSIDERPTSRTV
jgi:hypothetical protein